jgi:hypothetical protein
VPVTNPISPKNAVQQRQMSKEINYVPLTFPIPPPKSMMQQFHMQVGQSRQEDT